MKQSLAWMFGIPSMGSLAQKHLPGLWLGLAVSLLPALEFLFRAQFNGPLGASIITASWFGGTIAVLLASGVVMADVRPGKWIALLVVASIASSALNGRMFLSLPTVFLITTGMAVFMLTSGSRLPGTASRITSGLVFGGVLASLFAMQQKFGGLSALSGEIAGMFPDDPAMAGNIRARIEEARAFSFFLYPNALGGFLLLSAPAVFVSWLDARRKGEFGAVIRHGLFGAIITAGIYSSGSIGALFSLGLALLAAVFIRGAGKKAALVILGIVAVLAIMVIAGRPGPAVSRGLMSKATILADSVASWRGPHALLVGTGPGTYGTKVGTWLPFYARSRYAHNWLVETWVETGLLGVLALGGFILALFRACVFAIRGKGLNELGLGIGWLALLIHMMADIGYILPSVVLPWFAVSGILARMSPGKPGRQVSLSLPRAFTALLLISPVLLATLLQGAGASLYLGLILGIAVAYVVWKSLSGNGLRGVMGAGDAPMVALLVAGIIWLLGTNALSRTWPSITEGIGLVALVLAVRMITRNGGWTAMLPARIFMFSVVVHGVWAVIEAIIRPGQPAFTSFPNPNFLGAYLVAGMGLSLWNSFEHKGRNRLFYRSAAVASFAGIAASRSSGAGLAAVAVVMAILAWRGYLSRDNRHRWWSGSLAFGLLMAIVAIPPINPMSIYQRMNIWHEGALALREIPLGAGPGNYSAAVAPVRLPSYTYAGIARYSLRADFAHCEPLQFAVEWGMPALGLMAWLVCTVIMSLNRGNAGWGLALLGLVLHGLVDFPLRAPPIEILVAIAIGLITAGYGRRKRVNPVKTRFPAGAVAMAVLVSLFAGLGVARHGIARFGDERMCLSDRLVIAMEPVNAGSYLDIGRYNYHEDLMRSEMHPRVGRKASFGEEWTGIGKELSGHDKKSYYSCAGLTWAEINDEFCFSRAVKEANVVDYPEKSYFNTKVRGIFNNRKNYGWISSDLARVNEIEPFFLYVYIHRSDIALRQGNTKEAGHLVRKASLLRRQALKRRGLNEYEKAMIDLKEEVTD